MDDIETRSYSWAVDSAIRSPSISGLSRARSFVSLVDSLIRSRTPSNLGTSTVHHFASAVHMSTVATRLSQLDSKSTKHLLTLSEPVVATNNFSTHYDIGDGSFGETSSTSNANDLQSIVFGIAASLIAKLASRGFVEASQVLGLYDHLRELKETLSLFKAMLFVAEQKQEQNPPEWLRQLKDVLFDVENVLDEIECKALQKQVVKAQGTTKAKVGLVFSGSNPFRYNMAQRIRVVSKRLDKVAADRHKFSLQDVGTRVIHTRQMTHSGVNDSDVIGREHDKEKIIELLMEHDFDDDTSLSVIPIVGMGGLGKTTLAKFVFNDEKICQFFELKMWVCVSDDFDIKQLIFKIISSVKGLTLADALPLQQNLNMLDLEQLQNELGHYLAHRRFLLVLDDVWNEDRIKWIDLKNLIKVGARGSKVLVTTRSHSIASMMGTVPYHNITGLSMEDSLSLFVKWAFKEGEVEKYPHLKNIGQQIVKKCRGVPLAVRTLGSLLFSKFEVNEWEYVRDSEIWKWQTKDGILPALKISYDMMPSHLRRCFALFSLYPKDHSFTNFDVTSLWGALGLLASSETNMTRLDVANWYLHELLSRSFLQDFVNLGTVYGFKIHDLVHDLALFVAKDDCLHVNSHTQNIPENIRHLSFAEYNLVDNTITTKSVTARTILFPNGTIGSNCDALLNICMSKCKYLRFLDLSYSTCETLPNSVGMLKYLRYFSICSNYNIKKLPDSISKLQNLQVLKLDGCLELEALPGGLRKMISLWHLEITTKQSVLHSNEIDNLSWLEFLAIQYCHNLESISGFVKFPALKTLRVYSCQSLNSLLLDAKIFPNLETLIVGSCGNLDMEFGKDQYEEQSPKLKLKYVQFLDLPQLVALPRWLQETANSLHSLSILDCGNFELFPEWFSTLSNLKTITIIDCPELLSLPDNIHHLTKLESLVIIGCPELCRKCQPHVGEFWPKISHIKQVLIGEPEELEEHGEDFEGEEEEEEAQDEVESLDDTHKH